MSESSKRHSKLLSLIFILKYKLNYLRANVSKNQTTLNTCGNDQKIDFAHTFKFDTLSC